MKFSLATAATLLLISSLSGAQQYNNDYGDYQDYQDYAGDYAQEDSLYQDYAGRAQTKA